jgi:hypothetical protein
MDENPRTQPNQPALQICLGSPVLNPEEDSQPAHGRTTIRPSYPEQPNQQSTSCRSLSPLIKITTKDEMSSVKKSPMVTVEEIAFSTTMCESIPSKRSLIMVEMVYNEWGELVDERSLKTPPKSEDLSSTQLLRVIKKAYHHDVGITFHLFVSIGSKFCGWD